MSKYLPLQISITLSDIDQFTQKMERDLRCDWYYTGSVAVYLYALKYSILYTQSINDFDIIIVPDSCLHPKPRKIGEYINSENSDSNHGITFVNEQGEKVFDLICTNTISFCEISNSSSEYRLVDPKTLLGEYEELNEKESGIVLLKKINVLKEIVKKVSAYEIRTLNKKDPHFPGLRNQESGICLNFDDE